METAPEKKTKISSLRRKDRFVNYSVINYQSIMAEIALPWVRP